MNNPLGLPEFHPEREEDEYFVGLCLSEESELFQTWQTARLGEKITDPKDTYGYGRYPCFIKKDEVHKPLLYKKKKAKKIKSQKKKKVEKIKKVVADKKPSIVVEEKKTSSSIPAFSTTPVKVVVPIKSEPKENLEQKKIEEKPKVSENSTLKSIFEFEDSEVVIRRKYRVRLRKEITVKSIPSLKERLEIGPGLYEVWEISFSGQKLVYCVFAYLWEKDKKLFGKNKPDFTMMNHAEVSANGCTFEIVEEKSHSVL